VAFEIEGVVAASAPQTGVTTNAGPYGCPPEAADAAACASETEEKVSQAI